MVITACAGGDDAAESPGPTAAETEPNEPATSESNEAAEPSSVDTTTTTDASTTTTTTTVPADPEPDDRPTFAELEELVADGELDPLALAMTGLAVLLDTELDGAVPVARDDSIPDELTPLLDDIAALDDQLSDAQRAQIDAVIAEIEADSTLVWSSDGGVVVDGDGDDVQGFASMAARPGRISRDEMATMTLRALDAVMAELGGDRPRLEAYLVSPESREGDERDWAGWASTTGDGASRSCDMRVVNFDDVSDDGIYETVVHEVFHCWHGHNFDGPVTAYWRSPKWIKEGLATWVAAEVLGGSSRAQSRGHRFLLSERARLFSSSYPAVAFYWQIAALGGGVDHVWGIIPDLADQANSTGGFEAATAGLPPDALSRLASMTLRFEFWSDAWNFDSRDLGDVGRPAIERALVGPLFELAQPGEQAIVRVDVELDTSRSWVLQLDRNGFTTTRWIAADDSTFLSGASTTLWCISGECRCPDGREPFPGFEPVPGGDPRFIIGLSGTTEPASLKATPLDVDEACEEEPDVGPELVGVWLADPESTAEAFGEVYDDLGIGVVGASGDLSMSLYSDGRVVLAYEEVRLALDDPTVDTIILNGKGDLTWAIEDGRLVMRGPSDFAISLTTPAFGPDPLTVTDEDIALEVDLANARSVFDFERTGSSLTIASAAGFTSDRPDVGVPIVFPGSWVRIGDTP